MRFVLALFLFPSTIYAQSLEAVPPVLLDPQALVVNLSAPDINRVLDEFDTTAGGQRLKGRFEKLSDSIQDVDYEIDLATPRIAFRRDSHAAVSSELRYMKMNLGKVSGYGLECEDMTIEFDRSQQKEPIRLTGDIGIKLQGDRLLLNLASFHVSQPPNGFLVTEPKKCNGWEWLTQQLVRWVVRSQVEDLENTLGQAIRDQLKKWNEDGSFLRFSGKFTLPAPLDRSMEFVIWPARFSTAFESFYLVLSASLRVERTSFGPVQSVQAVATIPPEDSRTSFVAASELFAQRALGEVFSSKLPPVRFQISQSLLEKILPLLDQLFGLERLDESKPFELSFALDRAPHLRFTGTPSGAAQLSLESTEVGFSIWNGDMKPLESYRIGSTLSIVPLLTEDQALALVLGQNEWEVSSSDGGGDPELVAALLQELTFGAFWDTEVHPFPLWQIPIGGSEIGPRTFRTRDGYLQLDLAINDVKRMTIPFLFSKPPAADSTKRDILPESLQ